MMVRIVRTRVSGRRSDCAAVYQDGIKIGFDSAGYVDKALSYANPSSEHLQTPQRFANPWERMHLAVMGSDSRRNTFNHGLTSVFILL